MSDGELKAVIQTDQTVKATRLGAWVGSHGFFCSSIPILRVIKLRRKQRPTSGGVWLMCAERDFFVSFHAGTTQGGMGNGIPPPPRGEL